MALKIAQLGQPVLRRVATPVAAKEIGTPEFRQFLEQMRATLDEAGGVGLAAPQVFVSQRVFLAVLEVPASDEEPLRPEALINPAVVGLDDEMTAAWEGCLSFPELLVLVPRFRRVRVDYLDPNAQPRSRTLEGFPARVVQHEFDHLEGVLTLDRARTTHDIVKASEIETVCEDRGRSPSVGAVPTACVSFTPE